MLPLQRRADSTGSCADTEVTKIQPAKAVLLADCLIVGSFILIALTISAKAVYLNSSLGLATLRPGALLWPLIQNVLLLCLVTFIFWRNRWRAEFVVNLAVTLTIQVDLLYYRYFNDLPSLSIMTNIGAAPSVASSAAGLFSWLDLMLYLDLAIQLIVMPSFGKVAGNRLFPLGLAVAFIAFCIPQKSFQFHVASFFDRSFQPGMIVEKGILYYHAQDAIRVLERSYFSGPSPSETELGQISAYLNATSSPKGSHYSGVATGKNLIIIQVESLQGFVLERKVNGQEITPNLNKIIKESLYFPNVYPQTGKGNTSDAEFLALNGIHPLKNGVTYWLARDNDFRSLANVFASKGYSTVSMHGYVENFYNRRYVHEKLGFQRSEFANGFIKDELAGWGLGDRSFLRQSADKLKKERSPFFGFVITLSSHYPFDGHYIISKALDTGSLKGTLLGNYLSSIHYADEALGQFFDKLESEHLLDNTVVMLYGDHAAIPPNNRKELLSFIEKEDNDYNWLHAQATGLIIRLPSRDNARITRNGGEIDIAATTDNLFNLNIPEYRWFGQDLLNVAKGYTVLANGSWLNSDYTYIKKPTGQVSVYENGTQKIIAKVPASVETQTADERLLLSDLINRKNLLKSLSIPTRIDDTESKSISEILHRYYK